MKAFTEWIAWILVECSSTLAPVNAARRRCGAHLGVLGVLLILLSAAGFFFWKRRKKKLAALQAERDAAKAEHPEGSADHADLGPEDGHHTSEVDSDDAGNTEHKVDKGEKV